MIQKQEEDVKEEQSKIKLKIKEKNAELKKLAGRREEDHPRPRRGHPVQVRAHHQQQVRPRHRLAHQGRVHGLLHDPAAPVRQHRPARRATSSSAPTAAASSSTRRTRRARASRRPSWTRRPRRTRRKRRRKRRTRREEEDRGEIIGAPRDHGCRASSRPAAAVAIGRSQCLLGQVAHYRL